MTDLVVASRFIAPQPVNVRKESMYPRDVKRVMACLCTVRIHFAMLVSTVCINLTELLMNRLTLLQCAAGRGRCHGGPHSVGSWRLEHQRHGEVLSCQSLGGRYSTLELSQPQPSRLLRPRRLFVASNWTFQCQMENLNLFFVMNRTFRQAFRQDSEGVRTSRRFLHSGGWDSGQHWRGLSHRRVRGRVMNGRCCGSLKPVEGSRSACPLPPVLGGSPPTVAHRCACRQILL